MKRISVYTVMFFICATMVLGAEDIVLDTMGYWRSFFTLATPLVQNGTKTDKMGLETNTALPPEEWRNAEFDDSTWMGKREPPFASWSHYQKTLQMNLGAMQWHGDNLAISLICLRGKFSMENPGGGLKLSLVYRGGVVVYVNGKEVARGGMPKKDKIDMTTPAEVYPLDAYLKDGKFLDGDIVRLSTRLRTLENISIPREVLKRGVNVLSVELHRSPLPKEVADKIKGLKSVNDTLLFDGIGLNTIQLAGSGSKPNSVRPSKIQIWNLDPMADLSNQDWGDPCEPLRPIELAGARNGFFSGRVVVGSTSDINKIKGVISELSGQNGGSIPAAAVRVRYSISAPGSDILENLYEVPPKEVPVIPFKASASVRSIPGSPSPVAGAVVAVWITVNVPADAKPDDYRGEFTVTADGTTFKVPVKLRVYNYKLPNPYDFVTFDEIIQSPETLAAVYKVPLWSEKHWKYIEKSLSFLGAIGTKTCYIPLICKTNMGNAETMVRWVKGKNDKYTYDFTILEKYLDLVEKYQGKPSVVCISVWDLFLTLRADGPYEVAYVSKEVIQDYANIKGKGPEVTLLTNGKTSDLILPRYDMPEAKPLWKPLIDQLKDILKKRKLDQSLMLGLESDARVDAPHLAFWKDLLPDAKWVHHAHNRQGQSPLGYTCTVWDRKTLLDTLAYKFYAADKKSDDSSVSEKGWKFGKMYAFFPRDMRNYCPLANFRMLSEICNFGEHHGFGRIGADFWSLKDGSTVGYVGGGQSGEGILASDGRFMRAVWRNLNMRTSVLAMGPEGAVATVRYEMIREGIQEAEARAAVEKALEENKMKTTLAKKAQKILSGRNETIFWSFYIYRDDILGKRGSGFATYAWATDQITKYNKYYYAISDWQGASGDLYESAASATDRDGKFGPFSASFRESRGSAVKESYAKEVKIGTFTVKIGPNPFVPADNKMSFKFSTEKLTMVTAGIYNDKKEQIKKLAAGEAHSKWDWNLVWDGKNDDGVPVKEGKYTAKINIGGKEGSVTVGIEKKGEEKKEE